MGMEDVVDKVGKTTKQSKAKLREPELCPNCGNEGEDTGRWYWRCTTPNEECGVHTYIPTDVRINYEDVRDSGF